MGEAKRKKYAMLGSAAAPRQEQAVVTDIEELGKILELEKSFCDQCGAEFPLWPPEKLNEHLHVEHPGMFWPAVTKEWDDYQADTDLARRENYVTAYRVRFAFIILANRCDLYQKLVAAGVIVQPARG
jgi:hypothetical protein